MATIFDKPIAANPISTFSAMPLQFLQASADRRHQQWNQNKAMLASKRDDLLKTNALMGDSPRQQELLQEFDQRMDQLIEDSDGDYSAIQGGLDVVSQDMRKDMAYGELGQINKNFTAAMADKKKLQGLYENGKISDAGYAIGMQQISQHKTELGDNNQWGKYQGYQPSNIVDVQKTIFNNIDEINAKYDDEGMKFLSPAQIEGNINSLIQTKPGIIKAMQENWQAAGSPGKFKEYYDRVIQQTVQDKAYQEELKTKDGGKGAKGSGLVFNNIPMPNRSRSNYVGGSMAGVKGFVDDLFGTDNAKEFNDWYATADAKEEIAQLAKTAKTPFPENYQDRVDWIETEMGKSVKGSIVSDPASESQSRDAVTKEGFLNTTGAMYDEGGNLMSAEKIKDMEGKAENGNVTRLLRIVSEGGAYPKGTYIIVGKDGGRYYQEPSDIKTLSSYDYNTGLVRMATQSRTGKSEVDLKYPIRDRQDGVTVDIPPGNYQTKATLKGNSVALYQNGEAKYILHANGDIVDFSKQDKAD